MTPCLCSLFIWICAVTGYLCDQCRMGDSFVNAAISPNLQKMHLIKVPNARTMSDCTTACCNHSGCDLAWMFGRQCYIVNCQQKESCEPQKLDHLQSYVTFVLRPSPRFMPLPLFDNFVSNGKYLLGDQSNPEDAVGSLTDLTSLFKNPSLEELTDYADDYSGPQMDFLHINPNEEDKVRPNLDYISWLMADADKNLTALEVGRRNDVADQLKEDSTMSNFQKNDSETSSRDHLTTTVSQTDTILPRSKDTKKEFPTPLPDSSSLDKVLPDVTQRSENHSMDQWISEHQRVTAQTTTASMLSQTVSQNILPTFTAQIPMSELTVSTDSNIEMSLPTQEVQLHVFVSPEAQNGMPYSYAWNLIEQPDEFQGELKMKNSRSPMLLNLTAGLYRLRVAVSGEHSFGEGFLNVTIKPARINVWPVAVVSPKTQEVPSPSTSVSVDGSQSKDDDKIIAYLWEEIKGPSHQLKTVGYKSILHLSDLEPGNYTYRLTVTDSDGATNSTETSIVVHKPIDNPPIANAGPNQVITLPQNHISLTGNLSSDDHQIISYEWSLSPSSTAKLVAMQGMHTICLEATAMEAGEYIFQLTVTDSAKQQSSAQVTVIVEPENNSPPVAETGPNKELMLPVTSTTLDGSKSKDDHGIVSYEWENISGPNVVTIQDNDKPVAVISNLHVGTYRFRLIVKDQQGLSSAAIVSVTVKEGKNIAPKAHAGGKYILVLPNNSITLNGSKSVDDEGIVLYQWTRDGRSPAAGDVIDSDSKPVLQLTGLVEGIYLFHLKVTDAKGESDVDTAMVEVHADPRKQNLVELILEVAVSQLSEQQKDTLVRQLAVLLNVLDSDIKVQKIQAHSDLSTVILFYVQSGHPIKIRNAEDIKRTLHNQLLKEKADFLLYKVLRVDTVVCLLKCSGHGHCDPITKTCLCYPFWMENFVKHYVSDGESNCEWSVLYITVLMFALVAFLMGLVWLAICCYKSRKRTKIRKKTKYTILDNFDDQERMALRPKFGIKHRSTEHNSSLMVSESEFESDQDTIFSRDKGEQENPKNISSGALRNGTPFNFSSKCR